MCHCLMCCRISLDRPQGPIGAQGVTSQGKRNRVSKGRVVTTQDRDKQQMASEDQGSLSLKSSHLPVENTLCLLASFEKHPCPLDVEQGKQLKFPSGGPLTPTARNKPDLKM